ncbi:MAG: hypothetical protein FWF98_05785 [Dehalococcoidia bacterium]|nr:hypothetical protein [Dehalococcoidia bacterium]
MKNIFKLISPTLIQTTHISNLKSTLETLLKIYWSENGTITEKYGRSVSITIDTIHFETLIVQFKALGLIFLREMPLTKGGSGIFCKLTELGERTMLELKTIRISNKT